MATEWTKQLAQQHSQNLKHQPNHKLFIPEHCFINIWKSVFKIFIQNMKCEVFQWKVFFATYDFCLQPTLSAPFEAYVMPKLNFLGGSLQYT